MFEKIMQKKSQTINRKWLNKSINIKFKNYYMQNIKILFYIYNKKKKYRHNQKKPEQEKKCKCKKKKN